MSNEDVIMSDKTVDEGTESKSASAVVQEPVKAKKKRTKRRRKKTGKQSRNAKAPKKTKSGGASDYPRHSVRKSLRIPQSVLDQNAGRPCTDREAAEYSGVGYHGPFAVELSSAIKYGFLTRPKPRNVALTELAKTVLRPQSQSDELNGLRQAVLNAPKISEVYKHYRGENIPDEPFFGNALLDNFQIPKEKHEEFKGIFLESLEESQLIESREGKRRIIDVSQGEGVDADTAGTLKRLEQAVQIESGDSCFVMMPFSEPIGGYYKSIYEPAIKKSGLRPVRADDDIFATGKIIDQIWTGIHRAKVLVAELTGRNPNVFYELGLAHALEKPVVLVSSTEKDVPFDVQHIRVIYYNVLDPFWGDKLIAKITENVLSALSNPGEATLKKPV
jgi:hypothetical protein